MINTEDKNFALTVGAISYLVGAGLFIFASPYTFWQSFGVMLGIGVWLLSDLLDSCLFLIVAVVLLFIASPFSFLETLGMLVGIILIRLASISVQEFHS